MKTALSIKTQFAKLVAFCPRKLSPTFPTANLAVYLSYFNLKEAPFSITPDPAYLYLSPRHQEALGHLLFGTHQHGGFVQLTGEVGTGKTTMIRTVLEQKQPDVDVAVILNPKQSELEFVQSVCDELQVAYAETDTLKKTVDKLNLHLLESHAKGRMTVLIIDEAQNLSRDLLEQVRLLTNLETHKQKLLRVTLVGQPELTTLLARDDLRQLAQRITARYHLTPLNLAETEQYVQHRLRIAHGDSALFPAAVIKVIHGYANGIPRLVNVMCDRCLMGAYAQGTRTITPAMARAAGKELAPQTYRSKSSKLEQRNKLRRWLNPWSVSLLFGCLIISVALVFAAGWSPLKPAAGDNAEPSQRQAAVQLNGSQNKAALAANAQDIPLAQKLESFFETPAPLSQTFSYLAKLWDPTFVVSGEENPCSKAEQYGLRCYRDTGSLEEVGNLNRPTLLSLTTPDKATVYVLLEQLNTEYAVIRNKQSVLNIKIEDLDSIWTGDYLLLWKPEISDFDIRPGSGGRSIIWLRQKLEAAGESTGGMVPNYGPSLTRAVMSYQRNNGLTDDGIVGERTQILLGHINAPAAWPTLSIEDI